MSFKRIIPCLDIYNGRVVKGVNFADLRDAGDPIEVAKLYDRSGADELIILDIAASSDKRRTTIEMLSRIKEQISIPLTVGGGVQTISDIKEMQKAGADKISINSAAVKNPMLIEEAAEEIGSQAIVIAIDTKKNAEGGWSVYISGGRVNTGLDAVEWATTVEKLGAGEILLTSMDADGTKDGYDIELTRAVSDAVEISVIASGGAGKLEDFADVIIQGGADAVLAASLFHYGELTVKQVKNYLLQRGIAVRL